MMNRYLLVIAFAFLAGCSTLFRTLAPDPTGITRTAHSDAGWTVKDAVGPGFTVGSSAEITAFTGPCKYQEVTRGKTFALACNGPSEITVTNGGATIGIDRLDAAPVK